MKRVFGSELGIIACARVTAATDWVTEVTVLSGLRMRPREADRSGVEKAPRHNLCTLTIPPKPTMLRDGSQTSQTLDGGTVAWRAAIGGYQIVCTMVVRAGKPSVVSVVENGQYVERQELDVGVSASEVDRAALLLRQRYEPRIAGIAKRAWRFGRNACLTTSWAPQTPSPEDPDAA